MAESVEDVWGKIKKQENDADVRKEWTRIDENVSLYNQDPYVMRDWKNEKVERVQPVTLPALTNFANRVHTVTGGVLPQIKIRSKGMKEDEKMKALNFLYGAFEEANNALLNQNQPSFHSSLAQYGMLKKLVAMKVQVVEGQTTGSTRFDIVPIDPKNFVYKVGYNGVIWGAYSRQRSYEDILAQYPKASNLQEAAVINVYDYWDSDQNIVFANGVEVDSQANEYKYPPLIVCPLEHDIYEHNKGTYRLMNMVATILMTTSLQSCKGAMELKSERDFGKEEPKFPGLGSINVTRPSLGEEWKLIQLPDVYQATAFMWNVLSTMFQHGSYAFVEYGGLEFPLSNLALTNLAQGRDQVVFPLLMALTRGYRRACEMLMLQFREGKFKAVLGEDEQITPYLGSDVPDPRVDCNIKFIFKTTTISMEGEAYQMASVARDVIPERDILEHILKVDNPIESEHRLWAERGQREFPSIKAARVLQAFDALGMKEEAQLLMDEMDSMMEQQGGGPPVMGGQGAGNPMLPAGGNSNGGAPPPDLLKAGV